MDTTIYEKRLNLGIDFLIANATSETSSENMQDIKVCGPFEKLVESGKELQKIRDDATANFKHKIEQNGTVDSAINYAVSKAVKQLTTLLNKLMVPKVREHNSGFISGIGKCATEFIYYVINLEAINSKLSSEKNKNIFNLDISDFEDKAQYAITAGISTLTDVNMVSGTPLDINKLTAIVSNIYESYTDNITEKIENVKAMKKAFQMAALSTRYSSVHCKKAYNKCIEVLTSN